MMALSLDKLAYDAAQAARISWYSGQKYLAARLSRPFPMPEALRGRPMPNRQRLLADLRMLLEQDWRNIAAGHYAMPQDWPGNPLEELRRAVDFFADLGAVDARRHGGRRERLIEAPPPGNFPAYYLQNFHFQSEGYLSEASAERYDHQVEVLFGGGAAAMRRQALVPLRQALAGRPAPKLLDVACGTGQFLREVKANHPRLAVTGLDLSRPYLDVARRRLGDWSRVELVEAGAEDMPFEDRRFDVVTCVYLFHELPPRTRRAVIAELRRVLKPGGMVIFVDSLQTGDVPDYDAMLDWFPAVFHEPYYASYLGDDLDRLWSAGFGAGEHRLAYLSKIAVYTRNP
ncbi:MAG: methyltransferase domain-containing protein [Alphaproteobacteria bacterium]|nr:methyltransferase domain-containing protein [Alphaproteobacteria bacterium]